MQKIWRVMLVILLLSLAVSSVTAQETNLEIESKSESPLLQQSDESDSANVRVIPDEDTAGNTHFILISGLNDGEEIGISIFYDSDEVYFTERSADGRGRVELEIFTDLEDPIGLYTIEVLNASGDVIASDTLTILESVGFDGEIDISPTEAEAGTIFTIEITDVQQFVDLRVIFRNEDGETVFSAATRADVDGFATAEFPSEDIDAGTYSVSVVLDDERNTEIVSGELVILAQVFDVTTTVEPAEVRPSRDLSITLDGLEAETSATVEIYLDEEIIISEELAADEDGSANFVFTLADDALLGDYDVLVTQDGEIVSQAEFEVFIPEFAVTISPEQGTPGTNFLVEVAGLDEDEIVTVELVSNTEVLQSLSATADFDGNARLLLGQRLLLSIGDYAIRVVRNDTIVFGQPITITEQVVSQETGIDPENVIVTVSPESGAIPTDYTFRVEGLPPDTDVTLILLFDGRNIFSTSGTTDENGVYETGATSEPSDPEGTYMVEIRVQGEVIGTTEFAIGDAPPENDETADEDSDEAQETDEDADITATSEEISIRLNPTATVLGERVEITVDKLEAGEIVTIEVRYGQDVVYSTEQEASSNGTLAIAILTEEGDPTGLYGIVVLRDDEVLVSSALTVVASADELPTGQAEISISPESGPMGTDHAITVTGLQSEESFEILVQLDGETVFSLERVADENGELTVVLSSDANDEAGEYTIVILRDDAAETSATLIIEDAILMGDAEITIDPESGIIGTDHTVSVTGLLPHENFVISIEFAGEELFSEERQADDDGNFSIVLSTEEGDSTGEYEIIIVRENGGESSAILVALGEDEDEDFTLLIEPDAVGVGEPFSIMISGLNANETVSVAVLFDGDILFEDEQEADENGEIVLVLQADEGDPVGLTTIEVRRNNGDSLSADFELTGDEDIASDDDVQITVDPVSGVIGTDYGFTISGLEPEETFEIVVEHEGEIVFTSTRIADENGEFFMNLTSEEGDLIGDYSFSVLRGDREVASVEFAISEFDVTGDDFEDVELSIEPESGSVGTVHEITITGLEPDETVGLVVKFEDDTVFETALTADDEGLAFIILETEEGDDAGEYQILIFGQDGLIASDILIIESDDDLPDDTIILEPDLPVFTGRMDADTPEVEFIFFGEEGQAVMINLVSEQFDSYLTIRDSDGNELLANDDGGDGFNSRIASYILPYTGEYTIVATSYTAIGGGELPEGRFELTIELIEIEKSIVDLGAGSHFINDSLTNTRPEIHYIFEGEAGDTILISLNSPQFDTHLILLDENGIELTFNDDSGGSTNSQIGPYILPYNGKYEAVVTSFSYANYGDLTIGNFEFVIENVSIISTAYEQTITVELDDEQVSQFIEFEGSAGDVISVIVDSNESIDTTLSVTDPSGITLISDDDGGSGYDPEIVRLVLPQSGTYTLTIRAFTLGDAGEAELTINLNDVRTLDNDEVRTVRINSKQFSDILIFEGQAGETISLIVELESGNVSSLNISGNQGGNSLMSYQSFGIPNRLVLGFVVPIDGTVQINIQDDGGANAILSISIERE